MSPVQSVNHVPGPDPGGAATVRERLQTGKHRLLTRAAHPEACRPMALIHFQVARRDYLPSVNRADFRQ